VSDALHRRANLVQMLPGTPPGFPVAQFFSEEGFEFDTPFAQRLMADHNAALVEQFLNIPVPEWDAVIQPNGVLDDGHREAVAVWLDVRHGWPAYPEPVKATQPPHLRWEPHFMKSCKRPLFRYSNDRLLRARTLLSRENRHLATQIHRGRAEPCHEPNAQRPRQLLLHLGFWSYIQSNRLKE
jgi:hypothetical protein